MLTTTAKDAAPGDVRQGACEAQREDEYEDDEANASPNMSDHIEHIIGCCSFMFILLGCWCLRLRSSWRQACGCRVMPDRFGVRCMVPWSRLVWRTLRALPEIRRRQRGSVIVQVYVHDSSERQRLAVTRRPEASRSGEFDR